MGERSPLFFFHKHKVALFRIDSGDGVGLAMPDAIWNPTQCGCPTWHNYLGLSCLNNSGYCGHGPNIIIGTHTYGFLFVGG